MTQEIDWEELLQMFCDSNGFELRLWMEKPFLNKCYNEVWATDGKAVLMVNPKVCGGSFDTLEKPMKWLKEGLKWENGIVVLVQLIRDTLDLCPKEEEMEVDCEEKECPECCGSGHVEWHYHGNQRSYEAEFDCPVCDGSGILEEEHSSPTGRLVLTQNAAVCIGACAFRAMEIARVVKAADIIGATEVRILHLPNQYDDNGLLLAFSPDVRVILGKMIMSNDSNVVTLPVYL